MNEAEKLADKCMLINKTLVHVNGRAGAVEWMSDASGTLSDAAALIRRQAEQIKLLREALDVCAHVLNVEGLPTTAGLARSALAATKE